MSRQRQPSSPALLAAGEGAVALAGGNQSKQVLHDKKPQLLFLARVVVNGRATATNVSAVRPNRFVLANTEFKSGFSQSSAAGSAKPHHTLLNEPSILARRKRGAAPTIDLPNKITPPARTSTHPPDPKVFLLLFFRKRRIPSFPRKIIPPARASVKPATEQRVHARQRLGCNPCSL
jgi:hypothetical protein